MSLSFTFSPLAPTTGRLTGFSRGHMTVEGTVEGEEGSVTSAGRVPDQSMMLPLAVADLLAGLRSLIVGPGHGHYEFVGADSSFRLVFTRTGDQIRITGDHRAVASVPLTEFVEVCRRDLGEFARHLLARVPGDDPVYGDLADAHADLTEALTT
ncbi:conserved hypothetical protein [Parafrankia sp. EAN1pec]|uniref:hypothetical protein n=1 Tax=Parafrankia sp. (strain EAN1pec) TaxID=298653 RepID=UPI0000544095|nr:conserved hypothetical protein [Frankia sp. EAN1pec]